MVTRETSLLPPGWGLSATADGEAGRPTSSESWTSRYGPCVEPFDYSLWAAPLGLAIAAVELIRHRRVLPLLLGLAGLPLGGLVGRVAWEWFAVPPPGFDFGSEFEGYDWVMGFASVGCLIGTLAGSWLSTRRRRRDSRKAVPQGTRH